jgi:phosphoglycolate phosphatase
VTDGSSDDAIGAFDAIVYDLDGTLVRLAVDWGAVAADVDRVLRERGVDPPAGLWAMLEFAEREGHREAVEETIADHERKGARNSERLALADHVEDGRYTHNGVTHERIPIGICSLNCEAACRIAIEAHGLAEHVGAVVGRDSVSTYKPDPESLLATVEALGATSERVLFVGDSDRDAETARRAGTRFVYVSELLSDDADAAE